MTTPHDHVCVYRAADIGEADILVAWLEEQGVAAYVKDRFTTGMLQTSLIVAPRGIEVVAQASDAPRAVELLRQHCEMVKQEHSAASHRQIKATCEECGKESLFPYNQRRTVQTCPHCRAYLDVPGR